MGVITFNGVSSKSIGLEVETPPNYDMAQRVYETIAVPGRNGDLIMDTGAYSNSRRQYQVAIGEENGNFATLANKVSGWLNSAPGYARLEDSYLPLYYTMARPVETTDIANILQQAGRVTITFDRYPQRFLKSGETTITMTDTTNVFNPTGYPAKPLIRVNGSGSGTVVIGSHTISITNLSGYMMIDCETEQAYKDYTNLNKFVTLSNNEFPTINKGNTKISFSGGISNILITPRWWTI